MTFEYIAHESCIKLDILGEISKLAVLRTIKKSWPEYSHSLRLFRVENRVLKARHTTTAILPMSGHGWACSGNCRLRLTAALTARENSPAPPGTLPLFVGEDAR